MRKFNFRLTSSTALTAAFVTFLGGAALAQTVEKHYSLRIGETSVVEGLRSLEKGTGATFVYSPEQVRELRTRGIIGEYTLDEALRKLLEGSGLTVKTNGKGAYVIVQGQAAAVEPNGFIKVAADNVIPAPSAQKAAAPAQAVGLEEIIVNARRVEENIQRVPIAVSAFTESALQQQDIRDVATLTKEVGGLNLCCAPSAVSFVFLRGLTGVVSYFADAPAILNGTGNFFDVQNVQVLKGPQGTLFGIASNGGAIVFQPTKPGDTLSGHVSAAAGNRGRRSIEGAINVPVIEDKVLVRAAAQTSHTDGFVRDITTNQYIGDQNYWVGRLSVTLRPTEDLENYTVFQYYKSHEQPQIGILRAVNPTGLARTIFGPALDNVLATQQQLGVYQVNGLSGGKNAGGIRSYARYINFVNTTTWNFTDKLLVKNIFAYQNTKSLSIGDTDGTSLPILDGSALNHVAPGTPTWSDELQLQGKLFADRLDFTVGTFHTSSQNSPVITYANNFGGISAQSTKNGTLTRAVYGQGNYDLSDFIEGLKFTAGYRYTWDTRRQQNQRITYVAGVPESQLLSNRDLAGVGHFKAGSWTLGLQYQYTPDTMAFFTASKGYSSGGLALTAPPQFQIFQPESLTNLEAGVKSTFDAGGVTVRTNFSGFYGFYDNVQVTVVSAVQVNPPPAPRSLLTVTQNAATAIVDGVDADITIIPTESLELGMMAVFLDNHYTTFMSLDSATGLPVDRSNSAFLLTPKWKYVIRGTYHLPVDESIGKMSLSANYSHTAEQPLESAAASRHGPGGAIPATNNLDLSFNWNNVMGYEGLDASLISTNVTKNTNGSGQCACYTAVGFYTLFPAEPRQFLVRLRYSF